MSASWFEDADFNLGREQVRDALAINILEFNDCC